MSSSDNRGARYVVRYDEETRRWAVIDEGAAGLIVSLHETEDSARASAELYGRRQRTNGTDLV
jgi:hypothetical protein